MPPDLAVGAQGGHLGPSAGGSLGQMGADILCSGALRTPARLRPEEAQALALGVPLPRRGETFIMRTKGLGIQRDRGTQSEKPELPRGVPSGPPPLEPFRGSPGGQAQRVRKHTGSTKIRSGTRGSSCMITNGLMTAEQPQDSPSP